MADGLYVMRLERDSLVAAQIVDFAITRISAHVQHIRVNSDDPKLQNKQGARYQALYRAKP
jgi:hypothetical protein